MDTKRLILAVVLSIVVIFIFMPKQKPRPRQVDQKKPPAIEQKDTAKTETVTSDQDITDLFSKKKKEKAVEKVIESVQEDIKGEKEDLIRVETDLFIATFMNTGAGLKSFILKNYMDDKHNPLDLISEKVKDKGFGLYPFYFSSLQGDEFDKDMRKLNSEKFMYKGALNVKLIGNDIRELVFEYADKEHDLYAVKKFRILNGSYVIGFDSRIVKDGIVLDIPVLFGPDFENNISEIRKVQAALGLKFYAGNDVNEIKFGKIKTNKQGVQSIETASGNLGSNYYWVSYETNYFAAIFQTQGRIDYSIVKKDANTKTPALYSYLRLTKPKKIFLGPKDERILKRIDQEHDFIGAQKVISYGWFGSIAKLLLLGINYIHDFIPNYGWALVIFTLFLKILLFPLTYTSSVSMAKMQALQPKMKAIKKKYKNQRDPAQRKAMNMEVMALYKKEKVNPASGCLPLLLQMPILFGFFNLLRISINVRHEPWMLWIKDLSLKDPYYILPILMGVTQIIVTKMSPTSGESSQKKIMYIMPVVMVFLFMNFSSGLNLYWFVSNLLQIAQQKIINKKIYEKKKEEEKEKKALKRKKGVKYR